MPKAKSNATGLLGRWVLHILDGEYKVGQIALSVGPDHHLVGMRPHNGAPPWSQLMTSDDLCSDQTKGQHINIFDTEAELDAWLEWMNAPGDLSRRRNLKPRAS
jgi:hypothetical protein